MGYKLRTRCNVCGKYLIALNGLYFHVEEPCSGTTDAVRVTIEVEDDNLQKIWNELYGHPKYSDYELLNKIYDNKLLRWLIKKLIR